MRRPARAAAYLSIGVEGLLPRAHGGGDDTARGQKWLQGRLSRQDRQNSAERARSQAELGLRWTTIKATIRICELCRGTRALYRPCSMPVRTNKTGAQLATTGTQDQSQDALPQTMTSPQLSDFVCFHDFGRLRLTHAGCHARIHQDAGRRRRCMSERPAGTPAFAHSALVKVPPSRPLRPRTAILLVG